MYSDICFRSPKVHDERPGAFSNPIIASLVTGGARLMLAMLEARGDAIEAVRLRFAIPIASHCNAAIDAPRGSRTSPTLRSTRSSRVRCAEPV